MQLNKEIDKALKEYFEYESAESFDDADRSLEKAKSLAIIALAKKFLKDDEDEKEEVVEEKSVKAKAKEELKLTPIIDYEPVLVEVPKDEEPENEVPKPKTDEKLTDQWTAYSMQLLADEMARIQAYAEEIGEDTLVEAAGEITNGQVKEMGDITPLNIKLVLASLDKMKEEAEQE